MTRSQALAPTMGLTNYTKGLITEEALQGAYGDLIHITGQPIPVTTNFSYESWDTGATMDLVDTVVADDDPEGAELGFGGTKATGALDQHSVLSKWFPVGRSVSDTGVINQLRKVARAGVMRLLTTRLNRAFTVVDAAGIGTATIDCSSSATEVVKALQEHVDTVRKATGGYGSINLLWGVKAYREVANHSKVQGRINGGAKRSEPSTVNLAQMDDLIGELTNSRKLRTVYNSAAAGQTATIANLKDLNIYIVGVSPSPSEDDPGGIKLCQGEEEDGTLMSPIFYRHPSGTHERAKWMWRDKIIVPNPTAVLKVTITPA